MGDMASIVTALVPLLSVCGGAVAFFLHRMDKRIAAAELKVEDCEKHRTSDQALIAKLTFEVRRDHMAIRILFKALQAVDPRSAALMNVSELLRQEYQPEVIIPDDFARLIEQLEGIS